MHRRPLRRPPAQHREDESVARSDGLIVRVGAQGVSPQAALRLARTVVKQVLPGDWVVAPMSLGGRDFSVRRPPEIHNPTASQTFDFARQLATHRDVEDAEVAVVLPTRGPEEMRPLRVRELSSTVLGEQDHLHCSQSTRWALDACSARAAWELPPRGGGKLQGQSIVVGHCDTGYSDHPEIQDPERLLVQQGFDFERGGRDPRDPLSGRFRGHGTSTGSVIMSGVDGEITGIAPRCQLVPLRVTKSVVLLSFGKLAESIYYSADRQHHVISISLGGPIYSRALHRAVQYAVDRGVIICCAAGNVWPFVVYPARLDEVIACAATNCEGKVWRDSATGEAVDVSAPGESVWRASAAPNRFTSNQSSGTSYATAIAAGAAALWLAFHGRERLLARYGARNIAGVFKELLITAGVDRPVDWDSTATGAGILNARKLLAAPLPATAPAGGLRALHVSASPVVRNQLDDIVTLFPDSSSEVVRKNVASLLGANQENVLNRLPLLADEIAYHAVTDMAFRRALAADRPSMPDEHARGTSAEGTAPVREAPPLVTPRRASRGLKKAISAAIQ